MIKIHYTLWVGMCFIAFGVGVYIPAQRDYIKRQAEIMAVTDFLAEQPLKTLTSIQINKFDERDL